jgi:ABC-type transport system involved in multi-copper enzyme maturation permease subunit
MLGTIIRKEFLVHALSLRFAMALLLLLLLVSASMFLMGKNYQAQLTAYSAGKSANRQAIEQMTSSMEFHAMGSTASMRPTPLSLFCLGLSQEMSASITNSSFRDTEVGGTRYANPLFILFNAPDLTYIINVVMSLMAILFTFDAISGEKERQTLKLMLSNSVPRDLLLIGKWIGGYVSLLLPFLVAFLVGLLLVSIVTGVEISGPEMARIGVYLLVTCLYISVFFTMGLLISSWTHKSSTSLMIGLLVWVIIVLGIPNIAPIISKTMAPVPSAGQMAAEERQIRQEERQQFRRDREQLVQSGSGKRDRRRWHELKAAMEKRVRDRYNAHEEIYDNRLRMQAVLAMGMSRISPSACYLYSSSALMGTGIEDFLRLRDYELKGYPEQYRNARKLIEQEIDQNEEKDPMSGDAVTGPLFDVDLIPQFAAPEVPLKKSLRDSVLDLGLMGGYNALFFMIAFVKFLRYDAL